jgi:L-aspartate oxidase
MADAADPPPISDIPAPSYASLECAAREIQQIATRHCGILRSGESLIEGLAKLKQIPQARASILTRSQSEVRNLHAVAELIARAALAREESRGAHQRSDYPESVPAFNHHSRQQRDSGSVDFS